MLLPCNVIVYEQDGEVRVGAVDAAKMLSVVGEPPMEPLAMEVHTKLQRAIDDVCQAAPTHHSCAFLNRNAFTITDTELNVIAALAINGLRVKPKKG